mmetsp:Transcript_17215/g.43788  ORF Transcript_17215/g.43788 Transcript_17215/m.43788 type:complete len:227 (+) Transcript_17215:948-1628(+)
MALNSFSWWYSSRCKRSSHWLLAAVNLPIVPLKLATWARSPSHVALSAPLRSRNAVSRAVDSARAAQCLASVSANVCIRDASRSLEALCSSAMIPSSSRLLSRLTNKVERDAMVSCCFCDHAFNCVTLRLSCSTSLVLSSGSGSSQSPTEERDAQRAEINTASSGLGDLASRADEKPTPRPLSEDVGAWNASCSKTVKVSRQFAFFRGSSSWTGLGPRASSARTLN